MPYTPDLPESNIAQTWQAIGKASPDYTKLNTLRTRGFQTFDFRIDKKWQIKKRVLSIYLDVQNTTQATISKPITVIDRPQNDFTNNSPALMFRDAKGVFRYKTKSIVVERGIIRPSVGFQIDF